MTRSEDITEVMYIRIPKRLADLIRKIKLEEDFTTWSAAFLYFLQERRDSQIQLEISDVKIGLEKVQKGILQLTKAQLASNEHQDKTSEAFKTVGFQLGRLTTQMEKHEKAD